MHTLLLFNRNESPTPYCGDLISDDKLLTKNVGKCSNDHLSYEICEGIQPLAIPAHFKVELYTHISI